MLEGLKYSYHPDIRDEAALEQNFRERFEAFNRVRLTDTEFTGCAMKSSIRHPRLALLEDLVPSIE